MFCKTPILLLGIKSDGYQSNKSKFGWIGGFY